jgi:hypothetical protein
MERSTVFEPSTIFNRYVVAGVLLQLLGYAALSALVPHSEFTAFVEPLRRAPIILLVALSLLAIPAVIVALVVGAPFSLVGFQPTGLLVLVSTYIVSVVVRLGYRRVRP